jgi:hypothetical protein
MRIQMILPTILAIGAMPIVSSAQEPMTATQVVDKVVARQAQMQMLRRYSPLVETYIQMVRPNKELGAVLANDKYF